MDWLVFNDPSVAPLVGQILGGQLRWIGHPSMLDELQHVLGRGVAARYLPDQSGIECRFRQHCRFVDFDPMRTVRLICRDRDDQIFIDLALAIGARWLLSRDRAVLALAKRARAHGLEILTPASWARQLNLSTSTNTP